MAYASLPDLIARFGEAELAQVADTDNTGEIDPALVNRALGDADAEIDAALIGRYALPMTAAPVLLARIACDLARESLYSDAPTELVTERAKRARDMLAQIAKGVMRLDAPAAASADSVQGLTEMVSGRASTPFAPGETGERGLV